MGRRTRRQHNGGRVSILTTPTLAIAPPVPVKTPPTPTDPLHTIFSMFKTLPPVDAILMETTMRLLIRLNEMPKEQLDDLVKEVYTNTDEDVIKRNVEMLSEAGIIPPVEDAIHGGDDGDEEEPPNVKRRALPGRDGSPIPATPAPTPTRHSTRIPTPSRRMLDVMEVEAEEAEAQRRYEEFMAELNGKITPIANTYPELSPFLQELVRNITDRNMLSKSVDILFPRRAVEIWKSIRGNTAREIYEHHSVDMQCNNTIGHPSSNSYPPYSANGVCYMCGIPFNNTRDGMKPSCEHILPIVQAVFFLDLYKVLDRTADINVLRMEYGWAHFCCNQIKSDYSYIRTLLKGRNPPTWEFSDRDTKYVIRSILHKVPYPDYCVATKAEITRTITNEPTWINQRASSIKTRIDPILAYIGRDGRTPAMVAVAGLRNLVDTKNLRKEFLDILASVLQANAGVKRGRARSKKTRRHKQMAGFMLNTLKSQLPMLVEKFEPALEAGLRSSLKKMKVEHPDEAKVFLANWTKLNAAVNSELATGARRRKRTRRNKNKRT